MECTFMPMQADGVKAFQAIPAQATACGYGKTRPCRQLVPLGDLPGDASIIFLNIADNFIILLIYIDLKYS
jgi:hypothetical protein